jgi:hypothetical protein
MRLCFHRAEFVNSLLNPSQFHFGTDQLIYRENSSLFAIPEKICRLSEAFNHEAGQGDSLYEESVVVYVDKIVRVTKFGDAGIIGRICSCLGANGWI